MKNFIHNIREHWVIALICAAVILVTAVITGIMLKSDQKSGNAERIGYFLDTSYPMYVTEKDGSLMIELDGSESAGLYWETDVSNEKVLTVSSDKKEKKGKLTVLLQPLDTGYTTVSFRRSSEFYGIEYDTVKIDAEIFASEGAESKFYLTLSDAWEQEAVAGAENTAAPYLIQGNRILFPNSGDWQVVSRNADGTPSEQYIVMWEAEDDKGMTSFSVYQKLTETDLENPEAAEVPEAELYLVSESLNIEQRLECYLDKEQNWQLRIAGGKHGR